MTFLFIFFIFLILIVLSLPIWPYSRHWKYQPAGVLAIIAIILLFLAVRSLTHLEYRAENGRAAVEFETNEGNYTRCN